VEERRFSAAYERIIPWALAPERNECSRARFVHCPITSKLAKSNIHASPPKQRVNLAIPESLELIAAWPGLSP